MFTDLLHSSYFSLFLIVALGFMLGRVKIKGLSLDVSAVIFIALLFGHFGVIIPKELGNFGLVLPTARRCHQCLKHLVWILRFFP
jgi:putative transport protein